MVESLICQLARFSDRKVSSKVGDKAEATPEMILVLTIIAVATDARAANTRLANAVLYLLFEVITIIA